MLKFSIFTNIHKGFAKSFDMKTISNFILLLFLAIPLQLHAQGVDKSSLLHDIQYLSSDELEGRESGTPGNKAAQDYIIERFSQLEMTSQFADFKQFFTLKGRKYSNPGTNLIGFIPGSESSKIILIMAHYDHLGRKEESIYNGADDNASGTAALLELAAYFSKNRPIHSMLFAAIDAEEKGLLGSKALVEDFPFPLDQLSVVINMDMVSRSDDNKLFAVGTRHYPQLKPFLDLREVDYDIDLVLGNDGSPGEKDWSRASDHGPFHDKGIPFIYFGVEDHEDYHKTTDTFENIQPSFFTGAVELILNIIISIDVGFGIN